MPGFGRLRLLFTTVYWLFVITLGLRQWMATRRRRYAIGRSGASGGAPRNSPGKIEVYYTSSFLSLLRRDVVWEGRREQI